MSGFQWPCATIDSWRLCIYTYTYVCSSIYMQYLLNRIQVASLINARKQPLFAFQQLIQWAAVHVSWNVFDVELFAYIKHHVPTLHITFMVLNAGIVMTHVFLNPLITPFQSIAVNFFTYQCINWPNYFCKGKYSCWWTGWHKQILSHVLCQSNSPWTNSLWSYLLYKWPILLSSIV